MKNKNTSDKSILYRKDRTDNGRWVLREFCLKTKGAYFIDFETFVRKTRGSRKCYLDYDDHWPSEGHAAVARMLFKRWMDKDMLNNLYYNLKNVHF